MKYIILKISECNEYKKCEKHRNKRQLLPLPTLPPLPTTTTIVFDPPPIVGGFNAMQGEYPHMVLEIINKMMYYFFE